MDFDTLLFDRINVIKDIVNKYGEETFYISFSGGKDSTVLHYLVDFALPNNNIPRVFVNTGIEYNLLVQYVKKMAFNDNRIVIINPSSPIKKVLNTYGYPIKSKAFASVYNHYQNYGCDEKVFNFLGIYGRDYNNVPSKLERLFKIKLDITISDKCCDYLKKVPLNKFCKEYNKFNTMTGIRRSEGGRRANTKGCISQFGNSIHFHPLLVCDDDFVNEFIRRYKIRLCDLYYEPYNLVRTGCKGCPFNPRLQETLQVLKEFLPIEFNQCMNLWKPIYDLYIQYGYRLDKSILW